MNTVKYKIIKIPKHNGKFRTIYAPDEDYKAVLRSIVGKLERKVRRMDKDSVVHAFTMYRSPATNAIAHVGHAYTLSLDLEDFFDCVTGDRCADFISEGEKDLVFIDGIARQGLPTSPAVANLAFMKADKAILRFLRKTGKNVIYTRYADDLVLSFDEQGLEVVLLQKIREIVRRSGFRLNEKKTHLQAAKAGRRIITGYAVDNSGIHPTRATKRKLRAALHQNNVRSAQGLSEWCKCKMPREPISRAREDQVDEYERLRKVWILQKIHAKTIPERAEVDLGDGIIVTGDPCLIIGMSTFTAGWTSCMQQPNGQYRNGVSFWLQLEGTRVAYVAKPGDTMVIHGVERPCMQARCLLHTLRNGALVYDKIYGNSACTGLLIKKLHEFGAISVNEAQKTMRGEKVVGRVSAHGAKPYFDSLRSESACYHGRKVIVAKI